MRLKRMIVFAAAAALACLPLNVFAADAYCVYEADSSRLLFGENEEEKLPMASTTKIMTCILALENSKPDDIVEVPAEAAGIEGSSMYLKAGETISMEELLLGLMISSGNDAACAIAAHIAGSTEDFCAMMNKKAHMLGARNTNFTSPNGLPDDNHYTTAEDLGLIACYAMQNDEFRRIVSTVNADLKEDADSPARYLRSKNKILYQYEGGNGIKTGYTKAAGKCLVAGAERGGMQLVSVVLNEPDMFGVSMELLDKGFSNYALRTVFKGGEEIADISVTGGTADSVKLVCAEEIFLPLTENEFNIIERKVCVPKSIAAPVKKGDRVGTAEIYLDGELIAAADVMASQDVFENSFLYRLKRVLKNWLSERGSFENSKIFGVGGGSLKT